MKTKIILALGAVISCLSIAAYGSYAYLAGEIKAENVIAAGNIKIALIEFSPSEDASGMAAVDSLTPIVPGKAIPRTVQVENTGDNPAYVRIRVQKEIILAERNATPDVNLVSCDFNSEYWIDGNDGYYYYRDSLESGCRTEPLFETVIFDASMDSLYQGSTVQMKIEAQATQTAHNGDGVMEARGWPADKE